MGKRVFISYRHHQAEFVRRDLGPVLRAAGAGDVFIDVQRFTAGKELVAQMDAFQDQAEVTVAVLSPDYLASPMCLHELNRAIATNNVIPVVLHACTIPPPLAPLLQVRLEKNPADPAQWASLLKAVNATALGADAPRWLEARRQCEEAITKYEPAILQIDHHGANWRALFDSLRDDCGLAIPTVDLRDGVTSSRRGFVEEILSQLGIRRRLGSGHSAPDGKACTSPPPSTGMTSDGAFTLHLNARSVRLSERPNLRKAPRYSLS